MDNRIKKPAFEEAVKTLVRTESVWQKLLPWIGGGGVAPLCELAIVECEWSLARQFAH